MSKIRYKSEMDPIPVQQFLDRTRIDLYQTGFNKWDKIVNVVAPRDLQTIITVENMSMEYLISLLSNITLLGNKNEKIYAHAKINPRRTDLDTLSLGQRFIYRDHYTAIMESMCSLFSGSTTIPRGISNWTPYIIIGIDFDNQYVLAHYVPPMVEVHGNKFILLDGVHRCFITKQTNSTTESVVIERVKIPFPCETKSWKELQIIDKKPEKVDVTKRHFDLKVELFRDLRGIGIDG
ncbi:hypothetical protein MYX07_04030 [Patescibacteria group bacterium AH-259-L07]|nr:hypothetical protein [Patescibacteria group bacterium AH-259-L07]